MSRLYLNPPLYDLIHADGTDEDVLLLDEIARRHGNGGKSALEPACGTGRFIPGLLRLGWSVDGYDLSPKMVAFARKRLSKWGKRASIERGNMATFRPKKKYDMAFNVLSTFRHLLGEREAAAHLRVTYDALNPGGIFILGLDLAAYGRDELDEEVWTTRQGGKTVNHVMMTLPPDAGRRRERVLNFVTVPDKEREKVLEFSYDLRSYDSEELAALILKTKFSLAACYTYEGAPASLCGEDRALWLVLLKARS